MITLDQLGPALLAGGVVVLLALIGVRFAGRLGVPGLLLYLGIGLGLGAVLPGSEPINPETAAALGYAALAPDPCPRWSHHAHHQSETGTCG